jgi:hypothetical protein
MAYAQQLPDIDYCSDSIAKGIYLSSLDGHSSCSLASILYYVEAIIPRVRLLLTPNNRNLSLRILSSISRGTLPAVDGPDLAEAANRTFRPASRV